MDSETLRSDRPALAASLMTGGGAVTVISTFMAWFFLRSSVDEGPIKGVDISIGLGVLLFAAIAAILGMIHWSRAVSSGGKGTAIAAIVLFAIVGVLGLYAIATPDDALATFAAADVGEQLGVSETVAEDALRQAILSGELSVETEPGMYAATLGAAVGLLGAITGLVRGRRVAAQRTPAREPSMHRDETASEHQHPPAERSA